jgi:signal transduction histidine kinase
MVPCTHSYKLINFGVKPVERGINIIAEDNGIGIKESDLQRIWEVGYSTNNTSGLGLPFAKNILDENEGTIEIESKVDVGTKVTIFLPSFNYCEVSLHKHNNLEI